MNQTKMKQTESINNAARDAGQIINALTFAEVNSKLAGDTRRMMRNERIAVQAAVASGDSSQIKAALEEARRTAEMWDVTL